ncbi:MULTISPECIES: cupin domain-containing protein [Clostridium]|uniref:Cupin domain-containing protein n=1 Tax=Clostridium cibarium TaxID=2762247 RepID=A0ABR8PW13_9CLOT|nr:MULTISPECIES: cupin domain-containing protein [Clostridium]MBD7912348.1 cupin domain-containing protein [Clostridium cibarium]
MKIEKITEKMEYSEEKFTKKILYNEDKVLCFILNFKPDQGVPSHNHEESDLIVHILVGQGEMVVEGKTYKVLQGDVIHCKGKEMFSIKNTGYSDMSCLVMLSPNPSALYSKEV